MVDLPGALRGPVKISIQTRSAQRLVHGRRGSKEQSAIIGLFQYASMVRAIWDGASQDDPYGDLWLLQIEQSIAEAKEEITNMQKAIKHNFGNKSAMKVGLVKSAKPARFEITFSNPYGHLGAWLLVDMDDLVRNVLTGRYVGLTKRDESERLLHTASRAVRRAFSSPKGYRCLGLTRQDVRESNQKLQEAEQAMGVLPQSVLDAKLRAEYAPAIISEVANH